MFDKIFRLGGMGVLAVTVSGCAGLEVPSFAAQSQQVAPAPVATQVAPAPVPAATTPTPVRAKDNPFHRDNDNGGGGGGGGNDDDDSGWG